MTEMVTEMVKEMDGDGYDDGDDDRGGVTERLPGRRRPTRRRSPGDVSGRGSGAPGPRAGGGWPRGSWSGHLRGRRG